MKYKGEEVIMKKSIASTLGLGFGGLGVLIIIIFSGPISFGLGYFGGWILEGICGESVVNGLNMILSNITQHTFVETDIPLFCAIMTTVGGFFQSYHTKSSN
jgi:hypothetical protein